VRQACCGHGRPEDAYFIFDNGVEVRGADAVRLRECWSFGHATPGDVIELYLLVLDVEKTYRLCQMCNIGVVTVADVLKIVDTFCRKALDFGPVCDILEVDIERKPRFWRQV